jgi:hypothetical protein
MSQYQPVLDRQFLRSTASEIIALCREQIGEETVQTLLKHGRDIDSREKSSNGTKESIVTAMTHVVNAMSTRNAKGDKTLEGLFDNSRPLIKAVCLYVTGQDTQSENPPKKDNDDDEEDEGMIRVTDDELVQGQLDLLDQKNRERMRYRLRMFELFCNKHQYVYRDNHKRDMYEWLVAFDGLKDAEGEPDTVAQDKFIEDLGVSPSSDKPEDIASVLIEQDWSLQEIKRLLDTPYERITGYKSIAREAAQTDRKTRVDNYKRKLTRLYLERNQKRSRQLTDGEISRKVLDKVKENFGNSDEKIEVLTQEMFDKILVKQLPKHPRLRSFYMYLEYEHGHKKGSPYRKYRGKESSDAKRLEYLNLAARYASRTGRYVFNRSIQTAIQRYDFYKLLDRKVRYKRYSREQQATALSLVENKAFPARKALDAVSFKNKEARSTGISNDAKRLEPYQRSLGRGDKYIVNELWFPEFCRHVTPQDMNQLYHIMAEKIVPIIRRLTQGDIEDSQKKLNTKVAKSALNVVQCIRRLDPTFTGTYEGESPVQWICKMQQELLSKKLKALIGEGRHHATRSGGEAGFISMSPIRIMDNLGNGLTVFINNQWHRELRVTGTMGNMKLVLTKAYTSYNNSRIRKYNRGYIAAKFRSSEYIDDLATYEAVTRPVDKMLERAKKLFEKLKENDTRERFIGTRRVAIYIVELRGSFTEFYNREINRSDNQAYTPDALTRVSAMYEEFVGVCEQNQIELPDDDAAAPEDMMQNIESVTRHYLDEFLKELDIAYQDEKANETVEDDDYLYVVNEEMTMASIDQAVASVVDKMIDTTIDRAERGDSLTEQVQYYLQRGYRWKTLPPRVRDHASLKFAPDEWEQAAVTYRRRIVLNLLRQGNDFQALTVAEKETAIKVMGYDKVKWSEAITLIMLDHEEQRIDTVDVLVPNTKMRRLLKSHDFSTPWEERRPMVLAFNNHTQWRDLSDQERKTAKLYKYTESTWDDHELKFEYYSTDVHQDLQRISHAWDVDDMDRAAEQGNEFDTLPIHTARAAMNAGFSRESWNTHIDRLRQIDLSGDTDTEEELPVEVHLTGLQYTTDSQGAIVLE